MILLNTPSPRPSDYAEPAPNRVNLPSSYLFSSLSRPVQLTQSPVSQSVQLTQSPVLTVSQSYTTPKKKLLTLTDPKTRKKQARESLQQPQTHLVSATSRKKKKGNNSSSVHIKMIVADLFNHNGFQGMKSLKFRHMILLYPSAKNEMVKYNDTLELLDHDVTELQANELLNPALSQENLTRIGIELEDACMKQISMLDGRTRNLISNKMSGTYMTMGRRIGKWKHVGEKMAFGLPGTPPGITSIRSFTTVKKG